MASADKESAITRKMKRKKIFVRASKRGNVPVEEINTNPALASKMAVPQPYPPLNLMMYVVPLPLP